MTQDGATVRGVIFQIGTERVLFEFDDQEEEGLIGVIPVDKIVPKEAGEDVERSGRFSFPSFRRGGF